MKLSDYIVNYLENEGIDNVFGYIGGAITHMVDSIAKSKKIRFIQVYHEQTAAIAAEGYARNSGKVGVAMATSGPGATNLITGIADAYFDSIPTIYITGQVNTYEYKYNKPIRQQGFQETDIVSIVTPITKYAVLVEDESKIRYYLEKAFNIAKSGRPGPVLLDIPMNIQRANINVEELEKDNTLACRKLDFNISKVRKLIETSEQPIILAGGGINNSNSQYLLEEFINKNKIPVVTSLMGKGSVDEDNEMFLGLIGSYGNRCANMALSNSDLLLALGSRLDTRQTGALYNGFLRKGKIIHVDIDEKELEFNRVKRRVGFAVDVKDFLDNLNKVTFEEKRRNEWHGYLKILKSKYNQKEEIDKNIKNKLPYQIMELINNYSRENDIFCVDVGQNQMFAAQMLKIKYGQKFFTSGGMAPMGYALPVAVGASFANPNNRIFAIVGDGGFHISIQALMLISQYKLSIKVIVLNNSALGMITQFQDLYFNKRKIGTVHESGYYVPQIKNISVAYDLDYYKVEKDDLNKKDYLNNIFNNNKSCIIEVIIEGLTKVYPKLEYNSPLEDPIPKLNRNELKKNMIIDLYDMEKDSNN